MPVPADRLRRAASAVLIDRSVTWLLTAVYVVLGLIFVVTDYALHDEGLLTHYWASWARQDFIPVFFFQKVKPALAALYMPFTAGGVHATMAAHVVVSALAIPMTAAIARSFGQRLPNLPAIVLTFSPIFFFGGASGLSNIDGMVGVVAALYFLTARHHPLLAGIVAGALPWVRFELAIFSALIGLYGLFSRRDRPVILGLAVFPVVYAIGGMIYHERLLWMLEFPPSAPYHHANPIMQHQKIGLEFFLEPLLAVTPAAACVAALRLRELRPLEKLLLVYGLASAVAINIIPILQLANFGASPRYSIHILPALALLLGRAVEPWWEGRKVGWAQALAVITLTAWLATRQDEQIVVVPFLLAYAAILAAARFGRGGAAVALVGLLAASGPLLPVRMEVGREIMAAYLDPVVAWLRSHPEIAGEDTPIYTNSQLLAPYLEARGWAPDAGVYFVTGVDMTHELRHLTNPENDQRARLRHLAATDLYGRTIEGPLAPDDLPAGSILAMRVESRLPELFPEDVWRPRLDVLVDTPIYRIAVLRPGAPGASGNAIRTTPRLPVASSAEPSRVSRTQREKRPTNQRSTTSSDRSSKATT